MGRRSKSGGCLGCLGYLLIFFISLFSGLVKEAGRKRRL
jgi:hypothetical protein